MTAGRASVAFRSCLMGAFVVLSVKTATAAGPSTPEDWQRFYDACVQGTQTIAKDRGLGPDVPAKFCGCVQDSMRSTPEAERDARFPAIRDRCMQSATSTSFGYPPAGITSLRKTCTQRQDIPAAAMAAYCDCLVDQMQKTVSWRDFLLLDSAVNTKGAGALDAEEKSILGKALETTFYCTQKATR